MPTHEHYMQRAIELAEQAKGNTSPNPLVGAVIVRGDTIIAEGWHKKAGKAHAEVDAIQNAASKGESTENTTIYVSLEPCSHHGKTPPCTQAILAAGIKTVVYATSDTNNQASGGADILSAAGIEVISGICEEEARYTNRFFFHYQENTTPYVIAKFASSLDGRTATHTGDSQWITGTEARQRGHFARQEVDAIIVGAQTAIADQPQLTVRNPAAHIHGEPAHPLRIVLDSKGRVPVSNALFNSSLPGKTIIVTTDAMPKLHQKELAEQNIEVISLPCSSTNDPTTNNYPDIKLLLEELGRRNIHSVLVEGGSTVLGNFLDNELIDEVWAFVAPVLIGGTGAAPSIAGKGVSKLEQAPRLINVRVEHLDNDILIKGNIAKCSNSKSNGANE